MKISCQFKSGKPAMLYYHPGARYHGWIHWKHPDGQWVTLRKATDEEMQNAARVFALSAECDECDGLGTAIVGEGVTTDTARCPTCYGSGRVP